MSSTTDFLKEEVYPSLHAVDAGLMDHLNPRSSNQTYIVDCPQCGEHEGFYYPYSGYINCPRKNECGHPTSLWDMLEKSGTPSKEVFMILCSAAGVTPPDNEGNYTRTASDLVTRITRQAAQGEIGALRVEEFCNLRKLSIEEFQLLGYGYYPGNRYMIKALENSGADLQECENLGFISLEKKRTYLDDRIVGYWKQKDGTIRLWGRYIGTPPSGTPKYWFSSSDSARMQKTIPYRFSKSSLNNPILAVEGTIDADALRLAGFNGVATGQASVNSDQALFLSMAGAERLMLVTDSDKAGIDGVFSSLKNTMPLGISTSVSMLGKGLDDIDALRKAGRINDIKKAVFSAVPAAEFLANMYAASFYQKSFLAYRSTIESIIKSSDSIQRSRFRKRLVELGIQYSPESDASMIFANLIAAGASKEEANQVISRKFNLSITISEIDA